MDSFSFKNLHVWNKSILLAKFCIGLTIKISGHYKLREQLEAAVASIPQNIAEGHGRTSVKENIHYLYISRGSTNEVVTLLNIFSSVDLISKEDLQIGENLALEVIRMINTLIAKKKKFL